MLGKEKELADVEAQLVAAKRRQLAEPGLQNDLLLRRATKEKVRLATAFCLLEDVLGANEGTKELLAPALVAVQAQQALREPHVAASVQ